MTNLIACRTLFNETKLIPAEVLTLRASVYGLILIEHRILLAKATHTKKYVLPGGGINKGETNQAALIRETREETGIEIEVGEFLHFETDFFYYDPLDRAFHSFLFFYRCKPLTTHLEPPAYPPDEGLDFAAWIDIHDLTPDSFQTHGQTTMNLIHRTVEA